MDGEKFIQEQGLRNRLLLALPPPDRERLLERMQLAPMPLGENLFRQGEPIRTVCFPQTGVLSLVTTLENGMTIEISTIGNEGTTAVPTFLGADSLANASCLSQIPGESLVMDAAAFQEEARAGDGLRQVMGRYVHALLIQVGQAVACNAVHPTIERAARWLLTSHDRVGSDEFPLTQEFLAYMLGVRRASVTVAARTLQNAGLIRYRRGKITIQDRSGLEDAACECYGVMAHALDEVTAAKPHR